MTRRKGHSGSVALARRPAEEYQRCRYWPDCEIHLGLMPDLRRTQADAGPGERADIRALVAKGVPMAEVADRHRLTYTAVQQITMGSKPKTNRWETR